MINSVKIDGNEKTVVIDGEIYYLTKEKPTAAKTSSFERAKMTSNYYYIGLDEEVRSTREIDGPIDQRLYAVANYCQDEELLKKRAKEETLTRKLWRFSMEHDGYSVYLNNGGDSFQKYFIRYFRDGDNIKTFVSSTCEIVPGVVYFYKREYAEAAAEKFKADFQEVYGR